MSSREKEAGRSPRRRIPIRRHDTKLAPSDESSSGRDHENSVEPIEALHHPFDPAYHEAVNVVNRRNVSDGIVIKEVQKGYVYRDDVLRPAKVWVAQ